MFYERSPSDLLINVCFLEILLPNFVKILDISALFAYFMILRSLQQKVWLENLYLLLNCLILAQSFFILF